MLLVMVLCGRSGDEWLLQSCCSPNLQNTTYESNWLERKYQKMDEHGILRYITIYYTLRMLFLWVYCAKVYCFHRLRWRMQGWSNPSGIIYLAQIELVSTIPTPCDWASSLLPPSYTCAWITPGFPGGLWVRCVRNLTIQTKKSKTLISTTLKSTTVRHAFVSKYKTLRRHHHVFSIQMTTKPSFWLLVHLQ